MTGVICALAGGKARDAVLTTVSFTSNSTWVAPAGVTNVVSASGKGAAGVSDYIGEVANSVAGQIHFEVSLPTNPPYAQWSNAYGNHLTALSQLNLSYPTYGPANLTNGYSVLMQTTDYWYVFSGNTTNLSGVYLTGYDVTILGSPQTSGNITYLGSNAIDQWYITVQGYVAGGVGAVSTALGQTFPGGSYTGSYPNGVGNAAVTTTYTNVPVTPGTSYPIVVPSGGQVTLQYYV